MSRWSLSLLCGLWLPLTAWAHHTRDHMMLAEDARQVIAATRQGTEVAGIWLIWGALGLMLVLGLVRWWRQRPGQ